jgi:hypothetical protein
MIIIREKRTKYAYRSSSQFDNSKKFIGRDCHQTKPHHLYKPNQNWNRNWGSNKQYKCFNCCGIFNKKDLKKFNYIIGKLECKPNDTGPGYECIFVFKVRTEKEKELHLKPFGRLM